MVNIYKEYSSIVIFSIGLTINCDEKLLIVIYSVNI